MTQRTKGLWMVAATFLIAGILCTTIAGAIVGFDIEKLSTSDAERFTESIPLTTGGKAISKITLSTFHTSVKVEAGMADEISVSYANTNQYQYEITQKELDDGTLELLVHAVRTEDALSWIQYIGILNFTDTSLIVSVPQDYKALTALNITTSNASVKLMDFNTDNITVKTSNASVKAENMTLDSLALESSSGSITLTDIIASDAVSATSSNASARVENVTAHSLIIKSTNGSITLNEVDVSETVSAKTSNASIRVDNVNAKDTVLETSNGSVRGTMPGSEWDYIISAKTSNGSNTLANEKSLTATMQTEAEKALRVYTSNASIKIGFKNELREHME